MSQNKISEPSLYEELIKANQEALNAKPNFSNEIAWKEARIEAFKKNLGIIERK